jgi:hypothetical protein
VAAALGLFVRDVAFLTSSGVSREQAVRVDRAARIRMRFMTSRTLQMHRTFRCAKG